MNEELIEAMAKAIKVQSLDLRPVAHSVAHGTLDEVRAIAALRAAVEWAKDRGGVLAVVVWSDIEEESYVYDTIEVPE